MFDPMNHPIIMSSCSCHFMSCHFMSCHVMSCHVMSCRVKSYLPRKKTAKFKREWTSDDLALRITAIRKTLQTKKTFISLLVTCLEVQSGQRRSETLSCGLHQTAVIGLKNANATVRRVTCGAFVWQWLLDTCVIDPPVTLRS